MSYTISDVRRWNTGALATAGTTLTARRATAEEAHTTLSDGRDRLDDGWDGLAADAVLDAADAEKGHIVKLADGIEDLADELARAKAAVGPAVQTVRSRISEAEWAGLIVGEVSVTAGPGRDIEQHIVDQHAESISQALETVRSLDEHYARQIDTIATRLHHAIPSEVDRTPIPGPDDPWLGRAVNATTGAMTAGPAAFAHELDPETRGKHKLNPVSDDFGSKVATGLRGMGKVAGPLGFGFSVYDGVEGYADGETTAMEAAAETTGAISGGAIGGLAAGAAAGTIFGPVGTVLGAGIGAAVGSFLGQKAMDEVHESVTDGGDA